MIGDYGPNLETIQYLGADYLVALELTGCVLVLQERLDHLLTIQDVESVVDAMKTGRPLGHLTAEASEELATQRLLDLIAKMVKDEQSLGVFVTARGSRYAITVHPGEEGVSPFVWISTLRLVVRMAAVLDDGRIIDSTMVSGLRKKVCEAAVRLDAEDRIATVPVWSEN